MKLSVWIFFISLLNFHHSSLNFHHSSPITHHLKYPNSLHSTCLDIVFIFHHSNISTFLWDPYLSWVSDPFIFSKPTFIPLYARIGVFNSPPHVASLSLTFQFDSLSILHSTRLWWKSAWTHNATCHYHMYKPLVSQRSLITLLATIICTFHRLFFFLSFFLTLHNDASLFSNQASSFFSAITPTTYSSRNRGTLRKKPRKNRTQTQKKPKPKPASNPSIQDWNSNRTSTPNSYRFKQPTLSALFLVFFFFFFYGSKMRKGKKKKKRMNWDEKGKKEGEKKERKNELRWERLKGRKERKKDRTDE